MGSPTMVMNRFKNNGRSEPAAYAVDYVVPEFVGSDIFPYPLTQLPNKWLVAVATVTPALAARMLDCNRDDNRNLRKRMASKYADDIRTSRWRLTHQGIAFDVRGHLCDGQHRLAGCVESETPFPSVVWFGVGNLHEMAVLDTGGNRSVSDASRYLLGETIDHKVIATFRNFIFGPRAADRSLSHSYMMELVNRYGCLLPFMHAAFGGGNKKNIPAPVRAAVCRAYFHHERADLIRFAQIVSDRLDPSEPRDRSAKLLRKYLESLKVTGGFLTAELYCKAQRSLAAYLSGETIEKLYAASDDLFPLPGDDVIADRQKLEDDLASTEPPK